MAAAFITFEGIEGSGKTTQIRRLADELGHQGVPHRLTREPGGTTTGDAIRRILLSPEHGEMTAITELLLYVAARQQHLAQVIEPALGRGETVLCDRFRDATRAYQGYGRGLSLDLIESLHQAAGVVREPDMTLVLDLPVEEALQRARRRQRETADHLTRFEDEEMAFHNRVRAGYHKLAEASSGRVILVDGRGSEDEVFVRLRQQVAERLALATAGD